MPARSMDGRLRALALIANAACRNTAAALAHAAAVRWWQAQVIAAGGDPSRLSSPMAPTDISGVPCRAKTEAAELGRDLATLPLIEANALLGRLYTQALPASLRAVQGIYYTPPALVDRLLHKAEAAGHDWRTGRAIDPACGAGAFLLQAAQRMLAANPDIDPAIALANVASRLRGWEIDPVAAWLAQLTVEAALLPQVIASGRRLGPVVEVADALSVFPAAVGSWDLVIGNPPFGKVKDTPELRARFRRSLYGHPNWYGMFVDLAVHLARPDGGIVAYLTPASFLAGQYFRNLRRLLHEQAPPMSLDLVESRADVFEDVLQEVTLSAFRRGGDPQPAPCAVVHVTRAGLQIQPTGTLVLPKAPDAPWTLPRSPADTELVARLHAMPARLADWGYAVSTGPLVWNRHKPRLHDAAGRGRVPVVWAESVTADGRFALKASKRNHRAWFAPRGSDDPNLVDRPCVLVQRTTAKEQNRRLIAAEMPASLLKRHGVVTVENHLNMIRPIGARPKVSLRILAAFLATAIADQVLRCINASVAVSASELEAMPLPPAEQIVAAYRKPGFADAVRRLYAGITA